MQCHINSATLSLSFGDQWQAIIDNNIVLASSTAVDVYLLQR